jgi:hypothetical protein
VAQLDIGRRGDAVTVYRPFDGVASRRFRTEIDAEDRPTARNGGRVEHREIFRPLCRLRQWSGQRPIPDLVALEADLLRALLEGGELAARDAGLQVIRIIDV